MNVKNQIRMEYRSRTGVVRAMLLAVMMTLAVVGLGVSSVSQAQSTKGFIFGHAPAGDQIVINGAAGVQRETVVRQDGQYVVRGLPLGTYTVILVRDGKAVDGRRGVSFRAGGGHKVDFACKKR